MSDPNVVEKILYNVELERVKQDMGFNGKRTESEIRWAFEGKAKFERKVKIDKVELLRRLKPVSRERKGMVSRQGDFQ